MAKKNSGVKFIIYLIIFGVFFYYEYGLYKKYIQDKIIRDRVREKSVKLPQDVILSLNLQT